MPDGCGELKPGASVLLTLSHFSRQSRYFNLRIQVFTRKAWLHGLNTLVEAVLRVLLLPGHTPWVLGLGLRRTLGCLFGQKIWTCGQHHGGGPEESSEHEVEGSVPSYLLQRERFYHVIKSKIPACTQADSWLSLLACGLPV